MSICKQATASSPAVRSIKLDPTGLRKLSLQRIVRLLSLAENPALSLHDLISKIICVENEKRKNQAASASRQSKIKPVIYSEGEPKWDLAAECGFSYLSFFIKAKGVAKSGRTHQNLGSKKQFRYRDSHVFSFFFREETRELYALTNGRTWEIVRPYTNYKWPKKFAHHFLDADRITSVVRESIFGQTRKEEITYSYPQRLGLLESRDCLYSTIVMPFRADSSIFDLPSFQTPKKKKSAREISAIVQVGQIRILRFGSHRT